MTRTNTTEDNAIFSVERRQRLKSRTVADDVEVCVARMVLSSCVRVCTRYFRSLCTAVQFHHISCTILRVFLHINSYHTLCDCFCAVYFLSCFLTLDVRNPRIRQRRVSTQHRQTVQELLTHGTSNEEGEFSM